MELLGDIGRVECRFSTLGHSVSVEARPLFTPNMPYTEKSFRKLPMELLGDVAHVESDFGLFGDNICVSARYEHGLHRTYPRLRNHFERTP
jgi:hypothetical protein